MGTAGKIHLRITESPLHEWTSRNCHLACVQGRGCHDQSLHVCAHLTCFSGFQPNLTKMAQVVPISAGDENCSYTRLNRSFGVFSKSRLETPACQEQPLPHSVNPKKMKSGQKTCCKQRMQTPTIGLETCSIPPVILGQAAPGGCGVSSSAQKCIQARDATPASECRSRDCSSCIMHGPATRSRELPKHIPLTGHGGEGRKTVVTTAC
ncbi:uncharacterized protein LOC135190248 isoform X2 [Pogoniulus pusillus]|uniref:uncharacterized protein LOC135190248 isoform X2 n=1 Tax=Pogoniulus pusillus TaxID=488313 RepID=UPI0030B9722C